MEQPDALDPKLREKLQAAARSELPPPASEAYVATLTETLAARQRAEKRRKAGLLGWGAAAAVAAALLLSWRVREQSAVSTASVPACALPTDVRVLQQAAGGPRIDLGSFGMLAASDDAGVTVTSAQACVLRVALDHGVLAGDLRNLRPAQLRIATRFGEVVVRGTRFSVAARDELEVVLLHGKVEVSNEGGAPTVMAPKQVLRRSKHIRLLSVVEPKQAEYIGELLRTPGARPVVGAAPALPPLVVQPGAEPSKSTRSAGELLARAERERKAGALSAARASYAAASRYVEDEGEVALLRWVRLELSEARPKRAGELLAQHHRRFKRGKLGAEAAWLHIEIMRARGDTTRAQRAAKELMGHHPDTPQAAAARAYLSAP